jgi:hypothetical protein
MRGFFVGRIRKQTEDNRKYTSPLERHVDRSGGISFMEHLP